MRDPSKTQTIQVDSLNYAKCDKFIISDKNCDCLINARKLTRGVGNDPILGSTDYFSLIVRQNVSSVSTASDCIVRTVDASIILMLASKVVVDCDVVTVAADQSFPSFVYSPVLASVGVDVIGDFYPRNRK